MERIPYPEYNLLIRRFRREVLQSPDFPALNDEIHIWFISAADRSLADAFFVLSAEEQERALRFRHEGARACYQIGHTAVRLLLSRYLGVPADSLSFVCGVHGKPSLADPNGVHFNISHSGDWIALAFAHAPVGVDIERAGDTRRTDRIVRRFFHPQEADIYGALPAPERQIFFYEHWTAREAALKALGIGLTVEINAFCVQHDRDSGVCSITGGPAGSERLLLRAIDYPDGYIGCVAIQY